VRYTDRQALTTEACANSAKLRTRMSIYQYQEPRHDLRTNVVEYLHDESGPILDIGCGPGSYTRALREAGHEVIAADLSHGMVAEVGGPALAADAMALPVRASGVGAVIALHMLYHVPDPTKALTEFKRVLRPGGRLVISTNAPDDKTELRAVHVEAARRAGCPISDQGPGALFNLDEAELSARAVFNSVERHDLRSEVNVPTSAPVVAFIDSTRSWYGDGPEVLQHVESIVEDVIAARGAFTFATHSGFLVCR
jgi:ubiquinone/menaquinone biosynthesis C-methylase UbiE